ncbi:MAG: hypothetical protein GF381_02400 [Candidatus Pacebacteria bacterium]|nr:hypothetical protein [Candidatus Paceibacterota bacterium]
MALYLILPFIIIFFSLLIYRFTGRRMFLKMDLVQMIYAFFTSPLLFIWAKHLIYQFFFDDQLKIAQVSFGLWFWLDTSFSVAFLLLYAFIIIHFVTKNFEIRRYKDEQFNILDFSEQLHLWVSHVGIYLGTMVLSALLALFNLFFPLPVEQNIFVFWFVPWLGVVLGVIVYLGIWLSNFTQGPFLKVIKLGIAIQTSVLTATYLIIRPAVSPIYFVYWFILTISVSVFLTSIFLEKSDRLMQWAEKLHHKLKWSSRKGEFDHPK